MGEIFYSLKNTYEGYLKEQERVTKEAKLILIGSRMSMYEREAEVFGHAKISPLESTRVHRMLFLFAFVEEAKWNERERKASYSSSQASRVDFKVWTNE